MLHVKHGNMLVDNDLKPVWRHGIDQIKKLTGVQVVRGGDTNGPAVSEQRDGQGIGRVEREIGDERNRLTGAEGQPACIADQNAVGPQPGQKAKKVRLVRLLDPRRGQENCRAAVAGCRDRCRHIP